jgi:5-methylcytosine-specific restriction enzyme B
MQWRCASSKPKEGDAAYLMRTGVAPRGIVAAGIVVRAPFEGPHYDSARANAGEMANFVEVQFSGVRDTARDEIISREVLAQRFPHQEWSPQGSGIQIDSAAALALAEMWKALPRVTVEPIAAMGDEPVPLAVATSARNIILYGPPGTGKTYQL